MQPSLGQLSIATQIRSREPGQVTPPTETFPFPCGHYHIIHAFYLPSIYALFHFPISLLLWLICHFLANHIIIFLNPHFIPHYFCLLSSRMVLRREVVLTTYSREEDRERPLEENDNSQNKLHGFFYSLKLFYWYSWYTILYQFQMYVTVIWQSHH